MVLVVIFAVFLALMTYTAYNPSEKEILHTNDKVLPYSIDTLKILTWNIGYAGLDADMDFFMDGGIRTRQSEEQTRKNLDAIISFLRENQDIDFCLLQEVDIKSRRSYKIDELSAIALIMKKHLAFFALNYKVELVPVPITNPLGAVESGVAVFSQYNPCQAVRHSYPSSESWPTRIFNLRRCFISLRLPLAGGNELIVVNTHSSAYDNGTQRQEELGYLRSFLLAEEQKGSYVVVGGDWNQTPPGYPESKGTTYFKPLAIDEIYMPVGWQWIYDSATPSNRFLDDRYQEGITQTTILDFFLCSSNITRLNVETVDLGFANSDHNPVILTCVLDRKLENNLEVELR
jgi:endonuclease/exonuclease/phosphatase family metal-dependent hydrolase